MYCDATELFFRDENTIPTNRKLRNIDCRQNWQIHCKLFIRYDLLNQSKHSLFIFLKINKKFWDQELLTKCTNWLQLIAIIDCYKLAITINWLVNPIIDCCEKIFLTAPERNGSFVTYLAAKCRGVPCCSILYNNSSSITLYKVACFYQQSSEADTQDWVSWRTCVKAVTQKQPCEIDRRPKI